MGKLSALSGGLVASGEDTYGPVATLVTGGRVNVRLEAAGMIGGATDEVDPPAAAGGSEPLLNSAHLGHLRLVSRRCQLSDTRCRELLTHVSHLSTMSTSSSSVRFHWAIQ